MEVKNIDATTNRPDGERIIDGPYVFVDLEKYVLQLKKEEAWHKHDRNSITIYKTDSMTMVLTCLHKDAAIEENLVEGWLSVQVLDGMIDFTVDGKTSTLRTHQLMALHPEVLHTIRAKNDSTLLLINKS